MFSYKAPFSCPEGWALVPNDPLFNTGDFCVMKWEAKMDANNDGLGNYPEGDYDHCSNCSGLWKYGCDPDPSCIGTIVSTAEGMPISSVNQLDAISFCGSIGAQLLTNDHWMTIARNVSNNPDNWADKTIGSTVSSDGGLFRGNVNLNDSASCGSNTPLDGLTEGTNCIVNNTHHTDRNKRVLILDNGEEIWDFSGNLWQWTNDVIDLTPDGPPKFNDDGSSSTSDAWHDYYPEGGSGRYIDRNNLGTLGLDAKDLFLDGNYNANHGVGRIYLLNSATNRAFRRGGTWNNGTHAGVLSLRLLLDSSRASSYFGLRCFK